MKYEHIKPNELDMNGVLELCGAIMHESYEELVMAIKNKDHDSIKELKSFILGDNGQLFSLGNGKKIINEAYKEANK